MTSVLTCPSPWLRNSQMCRGNPGMVCRILEAGCRVGVGLGDRGKAEQAEEGQVSGYWQGLSQRTRAAPVPPSGARPVGFHSWETSGLSKRGRSARAPLCHGAACRGSLSQTDAGFTSIPTGKGDEGQGVGESQVLRSLCFKCCAVLATSGTQL